MKTAFTAVLLFILAISDLNAQIKISNDSLFVNDDYRGVFAVNDTSFFPIIDVYLSNALSMSEKKAFELEIYAIDSKTKSFTGRKPGSLMFRYYPVLTNGNTLDFVGVHLENAGKAYNNSAVFGIIGAVGGSALVLSGYPVVGSVITMGSGVIAFILQIRGNNKIIKGGKSLQREK